LPGPGQCGEAGTVTAASDLAELSSLRALVDDVTGRVVRIADGYRDSDDSAVTGELDQAERSLTTAMRALERAAVLLSDLS
jgi:hypothetical protein